MRETAAAAARLSSRRVLAATSPGIIHCDFRQGRAPAISIPPRWRPGTPQPVRGPAARRPEICGSPGAVAPDPGSDSPEAELRPGVPLPVARFGCVEILVRAVVRERVHLERVDGHVREVVGLTRLRDGRPCGAIVGGCPETLLLHPGVVSRNERAIWIGPIDPYARTIVAVQRDFARRRPFRTGVG